MSHKQICTRRKSSRYNFKTIIQMRIYWYWSIKQKQHSMATSCYSGFHHSRWITLCMAFPCPAADSLDPMDHILSFDVSLIIPKTIWKMIYVDFYLITAYIRGFDSYICVHRDMCIVQILLEFSLTWIQLIRLLAFHMPWDRSDSTLDYPLWSYIRNPLVHWRHIERLKAKKL